MPQAMEAHEPAQPPHVRLFRPGAVMTPAERAPETHDDFLGGGPRRGGHGCTLHVSRHGVEARIAPSYRATATLPRETPRNGPEAPRDDALPAREGPFASRDGPEESRNDRDVENVAPVAAREGAHRANEAPLTPREGPHPKREGAATPPEGPHPKREGAATTPEGSERPRNEPNASREEPNASPEEPNASR
jgi:hypothetical protein